MKASKAHIILPRGTKFVIDDALYFEKSQRNVLSFKDILKNVYHIETTNKGNVEYLCITTIVSGKKSVLEKLTAFSFGLYYTNIGNIEAHAIVNQKLTNHNEFIVWHNRLGHPSSIMMQRIIKYSCGQLLKNKKVLQTNEFSCVAFSQGKLIIRLSLSKIGIEHIHGDICGPIQPPSGPFRYFMVLIDASTRWSHVCFNEIRLRVHFPNNLIKIIRLDNADKFTSQTFHDYCTVIGITIEHPVAHVHAQNGLTESFIKRIQLIARPLLMRARLSISAWGHAIVHATILIRIRLTSYHGFSLSRLACGQAPNIYHLRIFGCTVYIPIAPPQRTKMGPQRRLGIHVRYESSSIIKYLEPSIEIYL